MINLPAVFPTNTHICHLYRTKEELLEVVVPYFQQGLARKEFCLWGVTSPLTVEEAKSALAKTVPNLDSYIQSNQLEIFDVGQLYGAGPFDAKAVRDGFLNKVKTSLAKGWKGFRCDGITSGVKSKDWKNFQVYEEQVTRTLLGSVTALCSYRVGDLDLKQLMTVAETHLATLLKQDDAWYIVDASDHTLNKIREAA